MDYCIFILSIYGNAEKKMLNGKKSSLFTKNEKVFVFIDLKVNNHLHTYKTHLHTKFGRILIYLSSILGVFSGILHNLEMFWSHGRIRLL